MRHQPFPAQVARLAVWLLLGACAAPLLAQNYTQTISLNPGWNSISLEVTPADTNIAAVFSSASILSVWTPRVRNSSVAFVQNPLSPPFNTAGWMVYFPTNQAQSVNNNLYAVTVNTPYLVNVGGSTPIMMTVTGRPSLLAPPFLPSAYTLRGFPVDPNHPPTFQSFFQSSPAQYNNGAGPLTSIYELNLSSGQWQQANPTDPMSPGIAYWVYTTGASSYLAPLTASTPVGGGLDFGQSTFEIDMPLQNLTSNAMTVTIADLGGLPRPLEYATVPNPSTQVVVWMPLPQTMTMTVPANGTTLLRLGIARSKIVNGYYATVLALSDGNGSLLHVPVTAQTATYVQAGLWIGDITVNAVAETYNNPTKPTPTITPFVMKALLHVTPSGTTRFLREVIEMQESAQLTTNGNGSVTTNSPAQYVLLTDNSLLLQPQFTGVTLRNGTPVGRRFSTAAFDFDEPGGATNFLTMDGEFGISNTVSVSIVLSPTTPTNPFLHRYNPDHNTPLNVYTVTRQIQFTFTPTDPSGQIDTDYGVNEIGGTYTETVTGLHQHPLVCSGTFHLAHTINVPNLNVTQ
jgi:hypothetical protein